MACVRASTGRTFRALASVGAIPNMTYAEYLAAEATSIVKHEWLRGELEVDEVDRNPLTA